jgi:hypothetical protein
MNTYKQKIQQIITSANKDIKIAVSWFTDVDLIDSLIAKSKSGVKIQLLLSADDYNLIRFNDFKILESKGVEIKKTGSSNALDGNFMHAKIMIVDEKSAFGGSYNYTFNATSNYEVFDEFVNPSLHLQDFKAQFGSAELLLKGLTEEIANRRLEELAKQHKSLSSRPVVLSTKNPSSSISLSEHVSFISAKKDRVEQLQNQAKSLQSGQANINHSAKIVIPTTASVPVKPHRFHGGGEMAGYIQERRNRFAVVNFQKYFIDNQYSIFKTKIVNEMLNCKGVIKLDGCEEYEVHIKFAPGMPPKVTLPKLEEKSKFDVHMYNDGSLCLFYPGDQKWTDYTKIAEYTIPWVIEWIYLYEIWKLTGKWEAEESPVHNQSNQDCNN